MATIMQEFLDIALIEFCRFLQIRKKLRFNFVGSGQRDCEEWSTDKGS